jgi:hypothetical protein
MRHDPAWLRLHDGHAHGVLADDPVHAHSGSEPSAGHTDQQNHHRPHSDAAQSHVDPARTDTSGSASLTRPNHPKAALPIDQRVGPAGSCTGGFRTQAPETLHNPRRSEQVRVMSAHARTDHSQVQQVRAASRLNIGHSRYVWLRLLASAPHPFRRSACSRNDLGTSPRRFQSQFSTAVFALIDGTVACRIVSLAISTHHLCHAADQPLCRTVAMNAARAGDCWRRLG